MCNLKSLRFEFFNKVLPNIVRIRYWFLRFGKLDGDVEQFLLNRLLDARVWEGERLLCFGVDDFIVEGAEELFGAFDHLYVLLGVDLFERVALADGQHD